MFVVLLALVAVLLVAMWVVWDQVRFSAPSAQQDSAAWLFEATVQLPVVRSHRRGWSL